MAINGVHHNDTRTLWVSKIEQLETLPAAAAALKQFRLDHTTPFRNSYELDKDYLWIEAKLEEKVALLKARAFSDADFRNKTAFGEDARAVHDEVIARMQACEDKWEAERIHIGFRQAYKPPILPVNHFMDVERVIGTKLMELRNLNYYDTPLEELRRQRGVTQLVVPH